MTERCTLLVCIYVFKLPSAVRIPNDSRWNKREEKRQIKPESDMWNSAALSCSFLSFTNPLLVLDSLFFLSFFISRHITVINFFHSDTRDVDVSDCFESNLRTATLQKFFLIQFNSFYLLSFCIFFYYIVNSHKALTCILNKNLWQTHSQVFHLQKKPHESSLFSYSTLSLTSLNEMMQFLSLLPDN